MADQSVPSAAVPAWCRMNDCYRTTQTNSDFCTRHGWNQPPLIFQGPEGGPQAAPRTPRSHASSRNTDSTTSPSAQLSRRLQSERIGARTTWGVYITLQTELRKQVARDAARLVAHVRTGRPA